MTANTVETIRQLFAIKLLIISLASVIAPILSEKIKWLSVPSIIFELMLGVIIGPQVLDLVQPILQLDMLASIGLTFLIFLAGLGIDLEKIRGNALFLALISWFASIVLALILVSIMMGVGFTLEIEIIALALTTTGLGIILPILQDAKKSGSKFGGFMLAIGAVGQFGPIVIISLVFTESRSEITALFFALFVSITIISGVFVMKFQTWKSVQFIRRHLHLSSQLPVRISIFLVFCLVCLAMTLDLNVLLGAFSAGILVQLFIAKKDRDVIDSKLKAIGYSFIIPLFFIVSGMKLDLYALASVTAISRTLFFFVCLLIVRGAPVFIVFRHQLKRTEQQAVACFSAAALPLIVVITQLGLASGKILPVNAVALVGAGVLSVLIFPVLGLNRLKK